MNDEADGPEVEESKISTATGDFYQAYKSALSSVIDEIRNVGADALAANKLNQSDSISLNLGISIVEREQRDLLQLLSKIVDEKEPSFFEEATVATITGLLKGVFLVAKHGSFTQSAQKLAQDAQAKGARDGRAAALRPIQAAQEEMVQRHAATVGADLSQPWKAAEAIRAAINKELVDEGKREVSSKTIYRWIQRIKPN